MPPFNDITVYHLFPYLATQYKFFPIIHSLAKNTHYNTNNDFTAKGKFLC